MAAYVRAFHSTVERLTADRRSAIDHLRGFGVLGGVVFVLFHAAGGVLPEGIAHLKAADCIAPLFLFSFGYVLDRSFRRRLTRGMAGTVFHFSRRHLVLLLLGLMEMVLVNNRPWGLLASLGIAGILAFPFLFGGMRTRLLGAGALFAAYAFGPLILHEILGPIETIGGGAVFAALPAAAFVLGAGAVSSADRDDGALLTAMRSGAIGVLSFTAGALLALAPGMNVSVQPVSLSFLAMTFGGAAIAFSVLSIVGDYCRFSIPVIESLGKNPLISSIIAIAIGEFISRKPLVLSGASFYFSAAVTAVILVLTAFVLKRMRMFIRI